MALVRPDSFGFLFANTHSSAISREFIYRLVRREGCMESERFTERRSSSFLSLCC